MCNVKLDEYNVVRHKTVCRGKERRNGKKKEEKGEFLARLNKEVNLAHVL